MYTKIIPALLACFFALVCFFIISNGIPQSTSITIGFAGDTMLGRLMSDVIQERGYLYPWGNLIPVLAKNDLNFVNLETTLTTSEQIVPKVFNFKSSPKNVAALKAAHINGVNTANNHILDFDIAGLKETLHTLDSVGIFHVGSGINSAHAQAAVIKNSKGIKVGFIGFTDNEPGWLAQTTRAGTNYIQVGDNVSIVKAIQKIRAQVDILVITMHWGPNMREYPTQEFIDFAHLIMNAGADIFHGHSSHVFQGVELFKTHDNRTTLIMYDTGDFVDDYAVDPVLRNDLSCLFLVTIKKSVHKIAIEKVQLIPIKITEFEVNKAEGKNAALILELMRRRSLQFGTNINAQGIVVY